MTHALAEVSEVVFFLVGAMTVVEVIDSHEASSRRRGDIISQT